MSLNKEIEDFLLEQGAMKVGFVTKETLEGGPPSTDLTYVLPEAESAVVFAVPLDKEKIRAFLRKDLPNGRIDHEKDNWDMRVKAFNLAKDAAVLIEEKGYKTFAVLPDWYIRTDRRKKTPFDQVPDIALRFLALKSGVGSFGWNGSVGIKGWGTAIILGAVVTNAKLVPTDPIPLEDSFCTRCKCCVKVCAFRSISQDEETSISIGGHDFTRGEKTHMARCIIVCVGMTGLEKDGKWSTWSPGRFKYPEDDNEVLRTLMKAAPVSGPFGRNRPKTPDDEVYDFEEDIEEYQNATKVSGLDVKLGELVRLTCGNCQLVCCGDPKENQENLKLLVNSGCVVQKEDGELLVLSPEEAEKAFEALDEEHKKLYR